jgi:translation initiation factor 3 subunit M
VFVLAPLYLYANFYSQSLSNLFNTLPRQSALRLPVHKALLELASSNDELQVVQVSRSDVEKWLKEWDVTPAEKSAFLKTLVDVFSKAGQAYVPPPVGLALAY